MSIDKRSLQRFQNREDSGEQAQVWLEASQIAAREGNLNEARHLLRAALKEDPGQTEAWLGLAWLAENRRERELLLQRVLRLEPGNTKARSELDRLQQISHPPSPTDARGGLRLRLLALASLILVAVLGLAAILIWAPVDVSLAWLVPTAVPTPIPTPTRTPSETAAQFEPQLEAALTNENWDRAQEIVAIMQSVDPSGEAVREWAVTTDKQYGQALVGGGQVDEAEAQFEQAVNLAPADAEARLWLETTQSYIEGRDALQAGQWDAAIEAFARAQGRMPDYADVSDRLLEAYHLKGKAALDDGEWTLSIESLTYVYDRVPEDAEVVGLLADAYRQRGISLEEDWELEQARDDLEMALSLSPDDAEAQNHLDEVMYQLFPPKRIEIDISEQRFYAWEGDTLVYKFLTSTGLRGKDTAAGHFKVLDKIPMAYSSIWRLEMPYWLGIYYVGSIENGIHALPIRPDGSVMWGGLLGQRASYGCVILSTEAARIIYNWAEIGTPVHIHY
jgi:tetratricopeptide (TPR) repeat protein